MFPLISGEERVEVEISSYSRKVLEREWIFPLDIGEETVVVEISTINNPTGGIIHFFKESSRTRVDISTSWWRGNSSRGNFHKQLPTRWHSPLLQGKFWNASGYFHFMVDRKQKQWKPIAKVHLITPISKVHLVTSIAKVHLVIPFAKAHPVVCIKGQIWHRFSENLEYVNRLIG